MIVLAASIVSVLLMGQTTAASQGAAARLDACLAKVDADAEAGLEEAEKWVALGGRGPARQCVAMALIAKGQPAEGAARLEQLANDKDGGDLKQRALYLAIAGNAWLLASSPDAAIVTLTNALKLKPDDSGLYRDRARAQMMLQKPDEAGKDLDTSLKYAPSDPDTLLLRALLRKSQKAYDAALTDVEAAIQASPQDTRLLTLRGDLIEAKRGYVAGQRPDTVDRAPAPAH